MSSTTSCGVIVITSSLMTCCNIVALVIFVNSLFSRVRIVLRVRV